ncbi:MAG: hypothetical protein A2150_03185 [Candidatus Muproteobacteria bacterium RBG_16_64_11]|uniref:Aspartyl protease n=1 Tax=Candidatus Muproteobacteria bacterium RBG_16_64_11 TaxID=1817758 RepID=A0A1F6TIF9_9PROT|nr:MAG: hypothetical protein A2150_03185 [Candidatus Muproteobacteria bacterium RBG_16_64_11]
MLSRIIYILLLCPLPLYAVDNIALHALFKDKAILHVDGARRVLVTGETSPEGVRLIDTDTRTDEAVVEIGGKRETLKMGVVISSFQGGAPAGVTLWADSQGFFIAQGSINGQAVAFLVDTGANTVALNGALAQRLGLDHKKKGQASVVTTASGNVRARRVLLDSVKVGEIVQRNVEAVVLEGAQPSTPLLGMSFLNAMEMRRDGNKMELIKKY